MLSRTDPLMRGENKLCQVQSICVPVKFYIKAKFKSSSTMVFKDTFRSCNVVKISRKVITIQIKKMFPLPIGKNKGGKERWREGETDG